MFCIKFKQLHNLVGHILFECFYCKYVVDHNPSAVSQRNATY